jgi:hypothetical protein
MLFAGDIHEKPRLMPEYKTASQHELYCMMQYISVVIKQR